MNYKFVKISSPHNDYLKYFYEKHTNIPKEYNDHLTSILNDSFSYSNAWSKYLTNLGNETYEIICSDEKLQKKWAYSNGVTINKDWEKCILCEQLKKIKPDVVFWQCRIADQNKFVEYIKDLIPAIKIHFTQQGSAINKFDYNQEYNFVITCLRSHVSNYNSKGIDAYFIKHGFYPNILNNIKTNKKSIDFSFFGSIVSGYGFHHKRAEYLEFLLRNTPLDVWTSFKNPSYLSYFKKFAKSIIVLNLNMFKKLGFNDSILPDILIFNKIIKWRNKGKLIKFQNYIIEKFKKPVYGLEMFQMIANSKVSFNIHGDLTKNQAENMKMYEVTGVGTCLLTDWKEDISEYFEPNYEIVTYKSKEDALEKVNFLLDNPKEREKIALNGQRRTLREHTLKKRVEEVNSIILKYL